MIKVVRKIKIMKTLYKMNTENNKIMAEFMGGLKNRESRLSLQNNEIWLPVHGVCHLGNSGKVLKYHLSWDWLIPVVEKIYNTDIYHDTYIFYNSSMFSSGKIELTINIESVYNACLEFIRWYNENSAKEN